MAVYYILLFIPICIQHFVLRGSNVNFEKKNRNSLAFFFLFFTVLVMLRHESVGSDTRNYANIFTRLSNMEWGELRNHSVEIGFSYFNKIISIFTTDPRVFFAITAVVTIMMIYPTYKRLCADPSLTIVLFGTMSTFVMMFSGIRQMLAVGIGFIAYEFTRKKKLIPFILLTLLAMSFHISAFMLAIMYPLYHAKITRKWLFVVVPSLAVVFVFNKQIFTVLALILERFTDYEGQLTQTGAYMMLILFALFAVFAFLIPDEENIDDETIGLRNFLLLSIVIQIFAPLHHIAMRMSYYYIIFIPLLLPKIISARSSKYGQVAIWARHIMVVFFFIYFFIYASGDGTLHVFPYHFFWESV